MTPQEETLVSNEDVPQPTTEEVRSAIQRLKNNKSAGSDGISAELLKAAGTYFFDRCLIEVAFGGHLRIYYPK